MSTVFVNVHAERRRKPHKVIPRVRHLKLAHEDGAVGGGGEKMPPVRREGQRCYRPAVQAHLRQTAGLSFTPLENMKYM